MFTWIRTKMHFEARHKEQFNLLGKRDLFGQAIRIIQILFWGQTVSIGMAK